MVLLFSNGGDKFLNVLQFDALRISECDLGTFQLELCQLSPGKCQGFGEILICRQHMWKRFAARGSIKLYTSEVSLHIRGVNNFSQVFVCALKLDITLLMCNLIDFIIQYPI